MAISKIGTTALSDDSVTTDKVANNAITTAMIASGEVGVTDLADGSITNAKISGSAAIAPSKIDLSAIAQAVTVTGHAITAINNSGNAQVVVKRGNSNTTGNYGNVSFQSSAGYYVGAIHAVGVDNTNNKGELHFRTHDGSANQTDPYSLTTLALKLGHDGTATFAGNIDINNSGQSQSLASIGGGSTNAALTLRGSTGSAYAWQVSSNAYVASALEFTRSTAVGGTTFSTPSIVIDSSGNAIFGGASPNAANAITINAANYIWADATNSESLNLNRRSSDGKIARFFKNASEVGSAGVNNSDNLTIQGNSGHCGVEFGTNALFPHKNSANIDATIDLGESSLRWKDIYLSNLARVDGTNQYYVGLKIRNNYSSVQSDWNIAASGGTSGWGNANGNFIVRDDTTNSTAFEAERGAGGAFGAVYVDANSNVLIGKTATTQSTAGTVLYDNGQIYATATGSQPLVLTRTSSDGPMAIFYKDSGEVGRIGANGSAGIFMSAPTNGGAAFILNDNAPIVYPARNNSGTIAATDNAIDLGASAVRFRDLYLAGGVNFSDATGGTTYANGNSANTLSDFEEGTWNPTLIAGTTNPTGGGALAPSGTYTKIGNRVWVTFYVGRSWTNSPSGQVYLGNLPFTVHATSPNYYSASVVTYKVNFGTANFPFLIPNGGATSAALYSAANGGTWQSLTWQSHMSSSAGSYISGTLHYYVA